MRRCNPQLFRLCEKEYEDDQPTEKRREENKEIYTSFDFHFESVWVYFANSNLNYLCIVFVLLFIIYWSEQRTYFVILFCYLFIIIFCSQTERKQNSIAHVILLSDYKQIPC